MNTAGAASRGGPRTAEELAELPDEGSRFELIEGVLLEMPPSGFDHGLISATIVSHIDRFVRDHGLGWSEPRRVSYSPAIPTPFWPLTQPSSAPIGYPLPVR